MLPKLSSTSIAKIANPVAFFAALGGLHDSDVVAIELDIAQGELAMQIDDLYSNFFQLPEYPGLQGARLIAVGIKSLKISVSLEDAPIRILRMETLQQSDQDFSVSISFIEGTVEFACRDILGQALV